MSIYSAVEACGVEKSYRNIIALKDFTIRWEKGILGLIGPNGAGKSTFIKILCTLLRPDSGYIRIFGEDTVKNSFEVRKRIGVLFENPVFHPNLEIFSSLCWIGELRGLSSQIAKRQVHELLEYFEIKKALKYKIKELSAGMRQKYGLILATLGTPSLIILDEPTSNLDPDTRHLFRKYINRLGKEHDCNFLISSHVLGELNTLCDGFVFLFNGKVVESGTREDLKLKISTQRFSIISKHTQKLISILSSKGIEIESIEKNKLIIKVENLNKLLELDSHIKQSEFSEEFEILQLESGVEALYHQLSDQYKGKG